MIYYFFLKPKAKSPPLRKVAYPPDPSSLCTYKSGEKHWNVKPDGERPIKVAATGPASAKPITVVDLFQQAVSKYPDGEAIKVERNKKWKSWTWTEYLNDVMCASRAFIKLGLQPFESVAIISFNSPEWFIGNMGAIFAGAKGAGIYTTNNPELCHYISEHSEARVALVENLHQLEKFLEIRDKLPLLNAIVLMEGEVPSHANNGKSKAKVYDWAGFMQLGKGQEQAVELKNRMHQLKPEQCCTLIYTSGTTGRPKAVMITHDNLTWTSSTFASQVEALMTGKEQRVVSYLPLSHVAGQMLDMYCPLYVTAHAGNCTVWFARPDALKGTIVETLKQALPTLFFGVPRVYEKFQAKLVAVGAQTKGIKKVLSTWAKQQGLGAFRAGQVNGSRQRPVFYGLAHKLVLSKIHAALGLQECHTFSTGAAPIQKSTVEYFGSLGICITEIYGMSENTGPQTANFFNYYQAGSCGVPMVGTELKIDHDEKRGDKPGEGEVCFRGRHIMMGYMKEAQKTQSAIDPDGFMHSGDIGAIDEKTGLVRITGRIKELIVTAGGENIAPVPIEDMLKEELKAMANCMMVGDKRKYNIVLVTPLCEIDAKTGAPTNQLAGEALKVSPGVTTLEGAQSCPTWEKYFKDGITKVNSQVVSRASKMQYHAIVPDFSTATGELTPTLKLKRPVVQEKHQAVIEKLYKK